MKKLLIGTAAAALMTAYSGAAFAADQDIDVSATVDAFCTIGGVASAATLPLNLGTTGTGSTADLAGGSTSVTLGTIICNAASNASLSSANGALTSGLAPVAGFDNSISYTATTTNLQAQPSLTANTPGTPVDNTGAPTAQASAFTASNVTVDVTVTANTNPLLAGAYADTITFAIVPQ
ncbi:MAG: hypothetical protein GC150_12915 [Rhizobiales bacterium]|nr:hypothetical protein [Hyphomicrobiales bacterium]